MSKSTPNRACLTCGAELIRYMVGKGVAGPRKYCSDDCKPRCAVEFCDRPAYSKAALCPMHDSQRRRGKPFTESAYASEWKCVVCGADVEKGSGRRRHCSSVCQSQDSRHKGERKSHATCIMCGQDFPLSRGGGGRFQRIDTKWCRDCGRDSPDALRFRNYGITPERYSAALEQGCEICGSVVDKLHVDHDHNCCGPRSRTCGECVRGLICGPCNRALGMFKDDVRSLESAIAYLNRWQGTN